MIYLSNTNLVESAQLLNVKRPHSRGAHTAYCWIEYGNHWQLAVDRNRIFLLNTLKAAASVINSVQVCVTWFRYAATHLLARLILRFVSRLTSFLIVTTESIIFVNCNRRGLVSSVAAY